VASDCPAPVSTSVRPRESLEIDFSSSCHNDIFWRLYQNQIDTPNDLTKHTKSICMYTCGTGTDTQTHTVFITYGDRPISPSNTAGSSRMVPSVPKVSGVPYGFVPCLFIISVVLSMLESFYHECTVFLLNIQITYDRGMKNVPTPLFIGGDFINKISECIWSVYEFTVCLCSGFIFADAGEFICV